MTVFSKCTIAGLLEQQVFKWLTNERLGQVAVKQAAAVCSGKKLCEKREGWESGAE